MIRRTLNFTPPIAQISFLASSSSFSTLRTAFHSASFPNSPKTFQNPTDDKITATLAKMKTLIVVGLSTDKSKPSYHVVHEIMEREGQSDEKTKITLIPVRPITEQGMKLFGAEVKGALKDIPQAVLQDETTLVDVFRKSSDIPPLVEEAINLGVKNIWLQQGVFDNDACLKAEANGMFVVADKCLMVEHGKLLPDQW